MSCNRWPMTAKCRIVVCFSFCFCFRVVSDNKCNKIKIISQNENNETPSASNFVHPEGFEGGMCGILPGKWETTRAAGYPAALVVLSLSGLSLFFPAPLPAAAFCSLRPSAFSGPFACCGLLFAAALCLFQPLCLLRPSVRCDPLPPPLCLLRPFPASGQTVITSTPTASSVVLIWAGSWLSVIRMSMSSIEQMRPNPLRPIFDESVSTMLWDAAFIIF